MTHVRWNVDWAGIAGPESSTSHVRVIRPNRIFPGCDRASAAVADVLLDGVRPAERSDIASGSGRIRRLYRHRHLQRPERAVRWYGGYI